MQNGIPKQLFRYRSTNTDHFEKELQNLKRGKVWMNFLDNLNDPFEGKMLFRALTDDEFSKEYFSFRDYCHNLFKDEKIFPEEIDQLNINKIIIDAPLFYEQVRNEAVVASFSKTPKSTLMWGHYADQFKGICLQFDFDKKNEDNGGPPIFPVKYSSVHPPEINTFEFYAQLILSAAIPNLKNKKENQSKIEDLAHEKVKLATITKSSDWKYEKEFRMLSFGGAPGYYRVPYMRLSGVVFGKRASEDTYHKVITALGEGIIYKKMRLVPKSYEYEFVEIPTEIVQQLLE